MKEVPHSIQNPLRSMTWGEFKRAMGKAGVKDDEEIWYIDISFPKKDDFEDEHITVGRDKYCGVSVG